MKQLTTAPVFNPAAKTLDFSAVSGFIPAKLLAVVDATAGEVLFNSATAGNGGSWAASVLTLQAGTSALSSSDTILAFYDDGVSPASDANLTAIAGAAGSTPPALASGASGLFGWLRKIVDSLAGGLSVSWTGQSVAVSNFPATQPVSAASLPLPSGAATSALQNSILTAMGSPLQAGGAVSDAQSAPFAGAVAMTVGTTYAAQRSVGVNCTAAGNVEFQFLDGSTLTLPIYVGWQTFPFACTQIVTSGTTATATYFNLK